MNVISRHTATLQKAESLVSSTSEEQASQTCAASGRFGHISAFNRGSDHSKAQERFVTLITNVMQFIFVSCATYKGAGEK